MIVQILVIIVLWSIVYSRVHRDREVSLLVTGVAIMAIALRALQTV
ncbi:MAG: hypothetical protein KAZ88_10475 [Acidimicrobiia bacterium]|nr:hypothetical protein [Acidimicrobiia bacterium]MBP8181404.1 hypothetical protein [Acidimicrobiia bacterium]